MEISARKIFDIAIVAYQNHLSARKGYGCAHRFHHGGMSCSEFGLSTIRSEIDTLAALRKIRWRLKECKDLTISENGSRALVAFSRQKKYGLLAGGLFLITGCGGGSESTTSVEAINGVFVPAEPDVEKNNSTIEGIDVNKNGVRDDVERRAATLFGANQEKYKPAIEHAMAEQRLITEQSGDSIENYIKSVSCSPLSVDELNQLTAVQLNSKSRRKMYAKMLAGQSVDAEGCAK